MKYESEDDKLLIFPETNRDYWNCALIYNQGGVKQVIVSNPNPDSIE